MADDGEAAGTVPAAHADMADNTAKVTWLVAAAVVAVLISLVAFFTVVVDDGPSGPPRDRVAEAQETAGRWLRAWTADDRGALRALLVRPTRRLAPALDAFRGAVGPGTITATGGRADITGDRATVPFVATVGLAGLGDWRYTGSVALADVDAPVEGGSKETERQWRVVFDPAVLHPDLVGGRSLAVTRSWPPRAPLLASDGSPLGAIAALRATTGYVGPATEEQAAGLGPAYEAGDAIGQSGLQAGFQSKLAGTPSGEVRLMEGDRVVKVEATFAGSPGQPVSTTLDPRLVAAADAALGSSGNPAALVAIQPSTGAIRAIANRPSNGFNRALTGRYPPGSTFKVVTSVALLESGITPDTRISCPKQITISGRTIRNAEEEELGDISFRDAFVHSCNTAFLQLAERLQPGQLVDAAAKLGFGRDPELGTAAAISQFPPPNGIVDQVSAAIGQGRVLATPLQMASVAATVAAGGYRRPYLVAPAAPPAFEPLAVAPTLQDLMRRVVTDGTGRKARLAGTPVAGKTGTAEFGTAVPLRAHAWFIAFRGDLAVAVVVEDGGFGGDVAAPIVADFLRRAG